ncbi:type III pantothenate kinase [Lacinutrix iliipiscaria]|uniref:Type III pantothenate kinase n=1 Tax=Lacinutrix iliipiscaria TaxID=1230532 RepID=A0ABW5WJV8_9FLAO
MPFCKFASLRNGMNLIIDVGNSFVKLAVFEKDKMLIRHKVQSKDVLKTLRLLRKEYKNLQKAIISSVGKLRQTDVAYVEKYFETIVLNSETKLPFENLYSTPKTLGIDRIALVSASVEQFPDKNVLIIDAGTCITFDFITKENHYLGGAISPGIRMRYKALHNFTANLPLLETEIPKNSIGNSTANSMHSGVVQGVLLEIEGAIQKYKLKYPDLTVILTGGDTNFLSKQLKSSIFANSNFLLEGLNYLLQFNTH